MYDSALPPDTLNTLLHFGAADIVVGIPSYRNGETIQHVTGSAADAIHRFYPQLSGVLLNVDGLAYDETLQLAQGIALPSNVKQVGTRYLGLPGKGSALRAIFEAATILQARVVVLLEADTRSVTPEWLPTLIEPVLRKEANFVLPTYAGVAPTAIINDAIASPLIQGLYGLKLRYPMAGEVAMAGAVAAYFADRDVWETDIARVGVDVWLALQMVTDGGQIARVPLSMKRHHENERFAGLDVKFMQKAGILFRTALLHERVWRDGEKLPVPVVDIGERTIESHSEFEAGTRYWDEGMQAITYDVERQWIEVLHPRTLEVLREVLHRRTFDRFDARLWAYLVYDFLVVYNLGEGDPDKVLHALYPLFLLRCGTLLARADGDALRWEQEIEEQGQAFRDSFDYFSLRWEKYVPPES